MNILNCRSNYFRGLRCQRLNPKLYMIFDEIQILNIPIWNLCSFCHFFNSSLNCDTSDKIFDIFTVSTIYFMSYYAPKDNPSWEKSMCQTKKIKEKLSRFKQPLPYPGSLYYMHQGSSLRPIMPKRMQNRFFVKTSVV